MKKLFRGLTLMLILLIATQCCFGQNQPLTAEIKRQTINDLSTLLVDRYAYKEVGQQLQQLLQRNLKAGKYDSYKSPEDFSLAVTNDLRSINSDRHLALNYSPQLETASPNTNTPTQPLSPEERARQASNFNRQMNFGFKAVQFLNGNIGYLKFDYFDAYLDYSSSDVDASLSFLKNSDALIIDLRDNTGGSSQMLAYILALFFKETTLAGTSYDRLTDTTTREFIAPQAKEKQLPNIDLYILTSRVTVSAAESSCDEYHHRHKLGGDGSAG